MKVLACADRMFPGLIADLQELIRQPSVSAKNEGIEKCARLVKKTLEKSGIRSEILRIDGAAPMVYGHVKSRSNPHKTLMFYNHYDVQPAEPLELWKDPPFGGRIRGNKIFGRGSSDDKGELMTRIKAVEAHLKAHGDVPCNIKFAIEGEEETGSAHVERYLKKFKSRLACDGVIWEFGFVNARGVPIISLGMKGLLFVEMTVKESKRDAHSSLAVLIKNPAWRLIGALHTMRNSDGRILIRDWYRDAERLTGADMDMISKEPFDAADIKKEFGVKEFVGGKSGNAAKRALAAEPTCNIAGFSSGYTGRGAKTVLPSEATAKIDFRLVPGMDPKKQTALLRRHLESRGYSDVRIRVYHGEAASRTSPLEPLVANARDAAGEVFGSSILSVSNAGTGPMHAFAGVLGAPCVAIGCTYMFARIHSPNEFARIDLLKKTTRCMCLIIEKFAKS